MVLGIERFKEWFRGYEDHYAIIGGTACDLLMAEEGLQPVLKVCLSAVPRTSILF